MKHLNLNTRVVRKIIIWQMLMVVCISLILGWLLTVKVAISFMLGGAISIFPGLLFARIFLKNTGAQAVKKVVSSFFYGEAVKWLAAIVLFILVFQWKGLQAIPFFLGIIIAQLIYWVAFLFSKNSG